VRGWQLACVTPVICPGAVPHPAHRPRRSRPCRGRRRTQPLRCVSDFVARRRGSL